MHFSLEDNDFVIWKQENCCSPLLKKETRDASPNIAERGYLNISREPSKHYIFTTCKDEILWYNLTRLLNRKYHLYFFSAIQNKKSSFTFLSVVLSLQTSTSIPRASGADFLQSKQTVNSFLKMRFSYDETWQISPRRIHVCYCTKPVETERNRQMSNHSEARGNPFPVKYLSQSNRLLEIGGNKLALWIPAISQLTFNTY